MQRHKPRVLVVDEDAVTRLQVDRQLDELGWDAVTVNCGEEAIRVTEMGMLVDVLLTELRLPDLDGRSVAWAIARIQRHVRVAFMASMAPRTELQPAQAPLLLKPFSTTALANALAGAIRYPR